MKHLVYICSFILISLQINAQSDTLKPTGAFIQLDSNSLNYGVIKKDSNGKRVITFKNTGDKPLIITDCNGSCGCTVPTCPTKSILPGNQGIITINYDTKRLGSFNKTVKIKSNAINHITYIKVSGTVKQ
tara:strand:+ start:542 stop:931 length:390 start_codon:yes stop_codon:yes gene_type:complete